jgi:membrane protease subunit HflK
MDWEKWQQKKSGGPNPPDLDKVMENFKRFQGKMPSFYILIAVAVIIWLLSGIYIVAPDQVGVVKRWGAFSRATGPGPHYHWPYPIESVLKPQVTKVRRIEIGFRTVNPGPPAQYRPVADEALMLTGDENIIDIWFIVQYRIDDAPNYLFQVEDTQKTIRDAAEAAMREVIGENKIDTALTEGKFGIQQDTQETLQTILNKYKIGFKVVAVQLQEVHPPQQVRAAFKDVASAREDRNKYINQAQGYANDILPKARGRAAELINQAQAYKAEQVNQAEGDSARFLSVLKEYNKAKDVTRKRLYLDTMQEVLGKSKKYIIDPENSGVLPLLNLESATPTVEPSGQTSQTQGDQRS